MKTTIEDLVKDKEWQKVRESLLGKWSSSPEWCCKELKKYLGDIKTTEDKKLVIVNNYLTGTAFRIGKINHLCVRTLRTLISEELRKRKNKGVFTLEIVPKK